MKSHFGFNYLTKVVSVLDFKMLTIRDLDESIDILCNHFGEENQDESLKEEHCPYFGVLWEAGIGLSQYIQKIDFKNKRVIEIGCGLALPSFVATRLGGDLIATDFHKDVPLFLQHNLKINNLSIRYEVMNWRDEVERTKKQFGTFDYVLGSDILYESQHAQEVAKALLGLLRPGGKIILADPGRAYVQKFITSMRELGHPETLTIENVDKVFSTKQASGKDIFIFEFNK